MKYWDEAARLTPFLEPQRIPMPTTDPEDRYTFSRFMVRIAVIFGWVAVLGSWAVFVFTNGGPRGVVDWLLVFGLLMVYGAVGASLHVLLLAMHAVFDIATDSGESLMESKRQTLLLHRLAKANDQS